MLRDRIIHNIINRIPRERKNPIQWPLNNHNLHPRPILPPQPNTRKPKPINLTHIALILVENPQPSAMRKELPQLSGRSTGAGVSGGFAPVSAATIRSECK